VNDFSPENSGLTPRFLNELGRLHDQVAIWLEFDRSSVQNFYRIIATVIESYKEMFSLNFEVDLYGDDIKSMNVIKENKKDRSMIIKYKYWFSSQY